MTPLLFCILISLTSAQVVLPDTRDRLAAFSAVSNSLHVYSVTVTQVRHHADLMTLRVWTLKMRNLWRTELINRNIDEASSGIANFCGRRA
jgi:hypothetical protein